MDDLSYAKTIKHGLGLEEEKRRIDNINLSRNRPEENRVTKLREEIRRWGNQQEFKQLGASSSAERGIAPPYNTCTRQTHGRMGCPGKKVRCYDCGLRGHVRGSMACTEEKTKTQGE